MVLFTISSTVVEPKTWKWYFRTGFCFSNPERTFLVWMILLYLEINSCLSIKIRLNSNLILILPENQYNSNFQITNNNFSICDIQHMKKKHAPIKHAPIKHTISLPRFNYKYKDNLSQSVSQFSDFPSQTVEQVDNLVNTDGSLINP